MGMVLRRSKISRQTAEKTQTSFSAHCQPAMNIKMAYILPAICLLFVAPAAASNYAAPPSPAATRERDLTSLPAPETLSDRGYGRSSADTALSGTTKSTLTSVATAVRNYGSGGGLSASNTILPFSQYQKHLKKHTDNNADVTKTPPRVLSRAGGVPLPSRGIVNAIPTTNRQEVDREENDYADDSQTPRLIYLPARQNWSATVERGANLSPDGVDNANRNRNPIRAQTSRKLSGVVSTDGDTVDANGSGRRPQSYSTASSREPLAFQKSVFRNKASQSINEPSETSNRAVSKLSSSYASLGSAEDSRTALNGMFRPVPALNSRRGTHMPTPDVNGIDADVGMARPEAELPGAHTHNIAPAPTRRLSGSAPNSNIVNSIFAQSQSQVRHSPQSLGSAITPVQAFGPPLSGSPFDLGSGLAGGANSISSLMAGLTGGGGTGGGGGGAAANPLANFNPLQLLGQGSTLEQISRIAKNLLSTAAMNNPSGGSGGGANGELLSVLSKAIGAGSAADASKLTSTAVSQPDVVAVAAGVKNVGSLIDDANATSANENLVFSRTNSSVKSTDKALSSNNVKNDSTSLLNELNELPLEQRQLLEAAIRNGELDASTLTPTLNALLNKSNATGGSDTMIRSENKLMEWIQQNRPRASEKETRQNTFVISAVDRLPYYGRYCGSFVEHQATPQHYGVGGAVWAASTRQLIVSKFNFRSGSRTENITFWAGPAQATGTAADVLPSENGFYLRPLPLDLKPFATPDIQKIPAKIRKQLDKPVVARDSTTTPLATAAEAEEERTDPTTTMAMTTLSKKGQDKPLNEVRRAKRDLYEDLYRTTPSKTPFQSVPTLYGVSPSTYRSPTMNGISETSPRSIHFTIQPSSLFATTLASTVNSEAPTSTTTVMSMYGPPVPLTPSPAIPFQPSTANFVITAGDATATLAPTNQSADRGEFSSLDWYAGGQPLVLTMPVGRRVTDLHWVALFDHIAKKAIAYVLIPDGPGFQVPAMVQLRPFAANAGYELRSGPIRVLDTKTIEVSDFYFVGGGVPAWFMIGKDILPNANGYIVPIYNQTTKTFDCDSLRDYSGESVTLRLPGTLEVRDVFWFSVFSIPRGASLTHLYLPYNEIHAPPDLDAIATPQCSWKSGTA